MAYSHALFFSDKIYSIKSIINYLKFLTVASNIGYLSLVESFKSEFEKHKSSTSIKKRDIFAKKLKEKRYSECSTWSLAEALAVGSILLFVVPEVELTVAA